MIEWEVASSLATASGREEDRATKKPAMGIKYLCFLAESMIVLHLRQLNSIRTNEDLKGFNACKRKAIQILSSTRIMLKFWSVDTKHHGL